MQEKLSWLEKLSTVTCRPERGDCPASRKHPRHEKTIAHPRTGNDSAPKVAHLAAPRRRVAETVLHVATHSFLILPPVPPVPYLTPVNNLFSSMHSRPVMVKTMSTTPLTSALHCRFGCLEALLPVAARRRATGGCRASGQDPRHETSDARSGPPGLTPAGVCRRKAPLAGAAGGRS